jgi:hypothetical protein
MSRIIVETAVPGFSVSRKPDKLGHRSSDTAELYFDNVRVSVSNTIGTIGRGSSSIWRSSSSSGCSARTSPWARLPLGTEGNPRIRA